MLNASFSADISLKPEINSQKISLNSSKNFVNEKKVSFDELVKSYSDDSKVQDDSDFSKNSKIQDENSRNENESKVNEKNPENKNSTETKEETSKIEEKSELKSKSRNKKTDDSKNNENENQVLESNAVNLKNEEKLLEKNQKNEIQNQNEDLKVLNEKISGEKNVSDFKNSGFEEIQDERKNSLKDEKEELKNLSKTKSSFFDLVENEKSQTKSGILSKDSNSEQNAKDSKNSFLDSEKKVLKSEKNKIQVTDLRTENLENVDFDEKNQFSQKVEIKENDATFTLNLEKQNFSQNNIFSSDSQTASADGSNYRAMINNQIQTNIPEFVKAGNIILRDNNQGTINLVLHPDEIGNVKIHLSVDGNNVSGKITVSSAEAMEVFKNNAQNLRDSFIQSGFDAANFEVSYFEGENSFSNSNGENQKNNERSFIAEKVYSNKNSFETENFEFENSRNLLNFSLNIVA